MPVLACEPIHANLQLLRLTLVLPHFDYLLDLGDLHEQRVLQPRTTNLNTWALPRYTHLRHARGRVDAVGAVPCVNSKEQHVLHHFVFS